jgi:hypothetical protein
MDEMDANPYQAPPALAEDFVTATLVDSPNRIRVEGRCLVVRSGTVLPRVCIKTDQPVSEEDMVTRSVYWCSPLVLLLLLIGLVFVLIGYFVCRRKCTLTFGLSPEVRRRYRRRTLVKWSIAGVLLAVALLGGGVFPTEVVVILVILFIVALLVALVGNSLIAASSYRHDMFWIKGCSREFLARVQEDV